MAIAVHVTAVLQQLVGGAKVVYGEGRTVGELLEDLERRFPGLKEKVTNANGDLYTFVNIYKNDEDIRYLGKLDTPLEDGDVVSVLPALAGGA